MVQKRGKYDSAFKRQAVELCKGRKNIPELSRELGVKAHQLYRCRKEYDRLGEGSFFIYLSITMYAGYDSGLGKLNSSS